MPSRFLPLSLAITLTLVACPSPPEPPPGPGAGGSVAAGPSAPPASTTANPPGGGPADGAANNNQRPAPVGTATPQGNPTGPPVPPAEGPHAGEFDPNAGKGTEDDPMAQELKLVAPQNRQSDIKAGAHYVVKGKVEGACSGSMRIDVLEDLKEPPKPGSAPPGPLAAVDLPAPGAFEVAVPKGKTVALSAVCDANNDGIIGGAEPVSEPDGAAGISAAKSGVTLKLVVPGA